MHTATKKLLEMGIIPTQTVRLLKAWRSLPEDAPEETIQAKTQEELLKILDELGALLEQDQEMPELKETDLDLAHLFRNGPVHEATVAIDVGPVQALNMSCRVVLMRTGRIVFPVEAETLRYVEQMARRGNVVNVEGINRMITGVEPRYVNDDLRYYVCDVMRQPHA